MIGERTGRISAKLGEQGLTKVSSEFPPILFSCIPGFIPPFFLFTTPMFVLLQLYLVVVSLCAVLARVVIVSLRAVQTGADGGGMGECVGWVGGWVALLLWMVD